ncbi:MAG: ankyrin repeat domain-containing protein [Verrucomicrobiota bacterium]|nr:ankyrin repeat domain-containing protein [Verrucomicrobiota bacterium]
MKSIHVLIVGGLLFVGCATMLPTDYSLFDAIKKSDIEAVKQNLSAGANVNARIPVRPGVFGMIAGGAIASTGASVSASGGGETTTPLHQAAYYNRKEIAELLISKGADVNAFSKIIWTPLDVAVKRKHPEITDLLLKHGG